ncbi:MAG: hypothetical protein IJM37_03765 [Lachnospiraceae bacterium]|nr:hypothetical protein [Lachnospiraceae bacterium]
MKRPYIKNLILIILMISLIMTTSCNKSENASDPQISVIDIENQQNGLDKTEEKLNLEEYSLDYVFKTDDQPQTIYSTITEGEEGFYYFSCNYEDDSKSLINRIMFFDKKNKKAVPLCNIADCLHKDENCNACFIDSEEISYHLFRLKYNDGFIYTNASNSKGDSLLIKISEDGSIREQSNIMLKTDSNLEKEIDSILIPDFIIHRGYEYFLDGTPYSEEIFRCKVGSDKVDVVYENTGNGANVYRLKGYGDYLFFQSMNFTNEDYTEYNAGLFAMNVNNGELTLVKKDVVRNYCIQDNILYYFYKDGICSYDLISGETRTVVKNFGDDGFDLFVEKDKIYAVDGSNERICVFNLKGEQIETYDLEVLDMDFVDKIVIIDGYCFIRCVDSSGEHFFYMISDDKESDWIEIS